MDIKYGSYGIMVSDYMEEKQFKDKFMPMLEEFVYKLFSIKIHFSQGVFSSKLNGKDVNYYEATITFPVFQEWLNKMVDMKIEKLMDEKLKKYEVTFTPHIKEL